MKIRVAENSGFCYDGKNAERVVLKLGDKRYAVKEPSDLITEGVDSHIVRLIEAIRRDHSYLYL